jgi:hypothetical protein
MKGDPTSFEETMRDVNTSKWQEAKKIKIKSINTTQCVQRTHSRHGFMV